MPAPSRKSPSDERREPARQLAPARERQHFRVARVLGLHGASRVDDSASRYNVAFDCRRRIDDGHAVRDRPVQRVVHGLRLARFGHDHEHASRTQQRRDRDGDRMGRHVVERREVPLPHLLAPRRELERDDLDVAGIVEVRDGRIVEREVTVLPDAAAAEVQRMRPEQLLVPARLGLGIAGVALEVVELLQREAGSRRVRACIAGSSPGATAAGPRTRPCGRRARAPTQCR